MNARLLPRTHARARGAPVLAIERHLGGVPRVTSRRKLGPERLFFVTLFVLGGCLGEMGSATDEATNAVEALTDDTALQDIVGLPGFRGIREAPSGVQSEFKSRTPMPSGTISKGADGLTSEIILATASGEYVVEFDAEEMAEEVHELYGPGGVAPPIARADRGWSNGVDNRTVLTGASLVSNVVQTQSPTMACSGALIGPRIVRTALHCLMGNSTSGTGVLAPAGGVTVLWRRDNTGFQASATAQQLVVSAGYCANGCCRSSSTDDFAGYKANLSACLWKDWAYIVLPPNWNSTPFTSLATVC